ncbi:MULTISPECIES: DUF1543 domain-containing protein [unclassified Sphingobacterium]|uniref:DUF1543 domain-containing protein n=1 Tax=unclassified Sphingobacterium TaxID=2609468 RepID=UPI0010450C6D|nr:MULTISPECIES: DUF1543 domain-containing protein [unclassified Sphingobacterium]MCS3553968.1 hypothetical protein [Sphingobacterium sp. JUb21]TCR05287.1 uncharacterized protein DUF1543 [Sphingobacterium sp. JUb20]
MNLFMLLLGCKPSGRHVEQHDIYFGIAERLGELVPSIEAYWPEAKGEIHVDAWRAVTKVGSYQISISEEPVNNGSLKLYFVNMGGYKPNDMEEYHYKEMVVAYSLEEAKEVAKETVFFKHHISPHIDDKYGIDVDDVYEIEELLSSLFKGKYYVKIREEQHDFLKEDDITNGYFTMEILRDQLE